MVDPTAVVSAVAAGTIAVAEACRRPPEIAASAWRVHLVERIARVAGRLGRPRVKKAERARLESLRRGLEAELARVDGLPDAPRQ